MQKAAALILSLFSVVTTPVAAADFFCPAPALVPATLNLPENASQQQLRLVQSFLTNLKAIRTARNNARRAPMKDQITNCLMDHLYALYQNDSLQQPVTRADGATWFLVRDEAIAALNESNQKHLQFKPQMQDIVLWLNHYPKYGEKSTYRRRGTYTVANR